MFVIAATGEVFKMCDRDNTGDFQSFAGANNVKENVKEAQTSAVSRLGKSVVIGLLRQQARELEMKAAGVRRLADIVNVAGEHEYPLFAALAAVVRK